MQKNGPDRDQTNTKKALEEFQRLLESYPPRPTSSRRATRIHDCRQSLARAEYWPATSTRGPARPTRAAIARYERILTDYPDYERSTRCCSGSPSASSFAAARPRPAPAGPPAREYPQSPSSAEADKLEAELPAVRRPRAPAGPPAPEPAPARPPAAPPPSSR